MDFILASGIFAVVFIFIIAVVSSRGSDSGGDKNDIARRLTRPSDENDLVITKKRRPDEGKLLGMIYRLNLLRRLEEIMWQAGMYMRVGDILLVMVLLFGAGLLFGYIAAERTTCF